MENKNARKLLKKYLNGTCTPEEEAIIESWYAKEAENKTNAPQDEADYKELESQIWSELQIHNEPKVKPLRLWLPAAAAVVALIASVVYFYGYHMQDIPKPEYTHTPIVPGANKAVLVLSDGSKIDLNEAQFGELGKQAGVRIKKAADGQLIYDVVSDFTPSSVPTYNTIITPRGGQFQVNLPDGTKAWLNASSSIKFPTVFHAKERIVEISGEVYFEVAKIMINGKDNRQKAQRMPFIVNSHSQKIEVLGTHFNVNTYSDEESIKTTLLEGSVSVTPLKQNLATILKPGEQATLSNGALKTSYVNKEEAIAWKNGYFQFNNEDVKEIMRKISRWYDVDVIYHQGFVNQRFAGTISRFEQVSKVLHMLELTGSLHFKIEGRRITVMP